MRYFKGRSILTGPQCQYQGKAVTQLGELCCQQRHLIIVETVGDGGSQDAYCGWQWFGTGHEIITSFQYMQPCKVTTGYKRKEEVTRHIGFRLVRM